MWNIKSFTDGSHNLFCRKKQWRTKTILGPSDGKVSLSTMCEQLKELFTGLLTMRQGCVYNLNKKFVALKAINYCFDWMFQGRVASVLDKDCIKNTSILKSLKTIMY